MDLSNHLKPLFLFSLPRSGSTLSQRILASHPDIATVTEPSLLLPYLYSLKDKGVYSEYNHELTAWGIQDFCRELPNGRDDYFEEMRTFVLRLYAKAAKKEVKYFLDKAPHYYWIVEEIIHLFPEGKFIFLWRNPLAIVSSLMETWFGGRWTLYLYDKYLFEGLANLVTAYQKCSDEIPAIRYEDLLANPVAEWKRVFAYLKLPFDPELISHFNNVQLTGRLGDQPGMTRYQTLSQEPLEKWKKILANPIRKAWCRRYLKWIGQDRLAVMGYNLNELQTELDAVPVSLRFMSSDIWWISYGSVYRIVEGRMLKHKLHALRSGNRVYIHN